MKLRELENLLQRRPSVTGNTFGVIALFIISAILLIVFFILGLGLLVESRWGSEIFLNELSTQMRVTLNDEQRAGLSQFFGLFSIFLSAIFTGVVFICRMVLRRNKFILEIEDRIDNNIARMNLAKPTKSKIKK